MHEHAVEPSCASLVPTLLLAMPQLRDPNFERSVVLLCRQRKGEGSFGLILNHPLEVPLAELLIGRMRDELPSDFLAWSGGPVDPGRGWLLLGRDPEDGEATALGEGLFLSTSHAVLRRIVAQGGDDPAGLRFFVGYAGWGDGQLEAELAQSAWLLAPVSGDLIFRTPPERMWEAAIRSLGVDPFALQMGGGVQ